MDRLMTLLRHSPEDRIPPWGARIRIEDVFDLGASKTILQVQVWVPGSTCRVRLNPGNRGEIETTAFIDRPIGDHLQTALLVKGFDTSEFAVGDEIEFVAIDVS